MIDMWYIAGLIWIGGAIFFFVKIFQWPEVRDMAIGFTCLFGTLGGLLVVL